MTQTGGERYTDILIDQLINATPKALVAGESVVIVLDWDSKDVLFVSRPYAARATAHRMQTRHSHGGRAYVACRHAGGTTFLTGRDHLLGTVPA
ncbi:hypothetical protein PP512_gp29 [Gordonia phage Denise]|uniref:Uncharacterized protein n=1 Tax=Gordonia phage Denise TaxID=2652879 RepID=A0A5P8DCE3_9CAUD|nr:hypothetical protein PP512_gp29 [Gordonia phage Denise]QFP96645.1 hypothetical protein SEA_DENISE_29 [Gordonia phage Denise]